ncbi:MAG: acetyl-CoA carboxylase biotin carboxyl carrier protein [Sphingobacteriales bacterium]|jgi:acetyl-CoA carboxylase biotin carboxyl carrier protein
MLDLKQIQDLIKFVSKSGVGEVSLEKEDFKLVIKSPKERKTEMVAYAPQAMQQMQAPMTPAPSAPASAPADAPVADENANYITIKSPMIGTFYRTPSPDQDIFVNVGDTIKPGQVLCIVEAMKLFNEIESEVSGKIVKVLIDNASPVEYDQPLFLVDPS